MTLETPSILLNEKRSQDLKQYGEHDHNLLKYISLYIYKYIIIYLSLYLFKIGILLEVCTIKY